MDRSVHLTPKLGTISSNGDIVRVQSQSKPLSAATSVTQIQSARLVNTQSKLEMEAHRELLKSGLRDTYNQEDKPK